MFTINGGGAQGVRPARGLHRGNNELALALTMAIPLMNYVRLRARLRWQKLAMIALMLITSFSILGTHSRGALIAILAMAAYLWRFSDKKVLMGIGLTGLGLMAFMPASWEERMQSIGAYSQDGSAMGRINAWRMANHLAYDRFRAAAS